MFCKLELDITKLMSSATGIGKALHLLAEVDHLYDIKRIWVTMWLKEML
jgi:hypothetical protein